MTRAASRCPGADGRYCMRTWYDSTCLQKRI